MPIDIPRIDAHHHVWDLAVRPQTWLDAPEMSPIRRTFTMADLRPVATAAHIETTVLVQTVASEDETREFLAIAEQDPLVGAVVGWVDLTAPDVADRIAALKEAPGGSYLRGIRHGAQDEPNPSWLRRQDVWRGLRAVAEAGLVYELLVRPPQWPAALDAVHAHPDLQFVLDHCGKPDLRDGGSTSWWEQAIRPFSDAHVVCKVSGLVTEANWAVWSRTDVAPYVQGAIEEFGVEHVMFGSDWPVCLLATGYRRWVDTVADLSDYLSPDDVRSVFADTAARVYGLPLSRPRGWPC